MRIFLYSCERITNEKYKDDAILKKTFIKDFLECPSRIDFVYFIHEIDSRFKTKKEDIKTSKAVEEHYFWKIQVDESIVLNNLYSGRKISKGLAKINRGSQVHHNWYLLPFDN